jgi:hypothetical protein
MLNANPPVIAAKRMSAMASPVIAGLGERLNVIRRRIAPADTASTTRIRKIQNLGRRVPLIPQPWQMRSQL